MEEKGKEISFNLCQFYEKTGTCCRGELCAKMHREYPLPRIICFHHLYPDPEIFEMSVPGHKLSISNSEKQRLLDSFYVDVYLMLQRFGPLDDIVVAGNKSDSLNGNVLAMFKESDAAYSAVHQLDGQYYAGRKIHVTLTPITRLSNCLCNNPKCGGSETCNFVHQLVVSDSVYKMCFPRASRAYAEKFRTRHNRCCVFSPMDVLYGNFRTEQ